MLCTYACTYVYYIFMCKNSIIYHMYFSFPFAPPPPPPPPTHTHYAHTHAYACTHECLCMHTHAYTCTHMHTHACTHTHAHMHACTPHTHTHHTHTHTLPCEQLDCFHPSLFMHELMAKVMWNCMLTPAMQKDRTFNARADFVCPTNSTLLYTY